MEHFCHKEKEIAILQANYDNMNKTLTEIKTQNEKIIQKLDNIPRVFATKEEHKQNSNEIDKLKQDNISFKIMIARWLGIWFGVSLVVGFIINKFL